MKSRLRALAVVLGLSLAGAAGAAPVLDVQPSPAKPGDPVLLTVKGVTAPPTGTLGEQPLRFYPRGDAFQALAALPVELAPGPLPIKLAVQESAEQALPTELSGTLEVTPPNYPARELKVASQFVDTPPPALQARIKADQEAFAQAFAQPFEPLLFGKDFVWPRPPKLTSHYGDQRTLNGKKQSQHYGTDFEGRVGSPITVSNAGKVVLVREAFYSGNTVVLFHGANLYTAYFHLSKVAVAQGDTVRQGQRLGLVGKSGRVTGPHLHWGVKIGELYVDGATLVERIHFFQ